MNEQPEFDIPFPDATRKGRGEGVAARREARAQAVPTTLKWTQVRSTHRPKCDICIVRMNLGAPWHAPDPVMWERREGGTLLYACYFDAAPIRLADGLDPTPKR